MNTNSGQKIQMRATNFALTKLTGLATFESAQTQKRALSFLRPNMSKPAAAEDSQSKPTFFKVPTKLTKVDPTKKPADLLHQLNLA